MERSWTEANIGGETKSICGSKASSVVKWKCSLAFSHGQESNKSVIIAVKRSRSLSEQSCSMKTCF